MASIFPLPAFGFQTGVEPQGIMISALQEKGNELRCSVPLQLKNYFSCFSIGLDKRALHKLLAGCPIDPS